MRTCGSPSASRVLHTAHLAALAVIILTLPVDTIKGFLAGLALGFNIAIPAIIVVGLRHFFSHRKTARP